MNYEKIAWWIFWFAFGIVIAIMFYGFALTMLKATPAEIAFVLGLVSFFLFGNRLLFGYGWIVNILENLLSEENIEEKRQILEKKLQEKKIKTEEEIKNLSITALILILLKDLSYYQYAFLGVYLLLVIFTLAFNFNLFGDFLIGRYIEGIFWGASVVVFFVWGLGQIAGILYTELIEKIKTKGGQVA